VTTEQRRQVLGALAGDKTTLKSLPADSPLRAHLAAATEALKAWCRGDEAAVRATVAGIPYRSPLRDLRFLLRALSCYPHDPEGGKSALARIAPDSPLACPAQVVRALYSGQHKALKPMAREFVRAITGKGGGKAQPKQLFSTLLAEAKKHPDTPGLKEALTALLAYYPAGRNAFAKVYGPVDPVEWERMKALLAERKRHLDDALDAWEAVFHQYRERGRPLHAAVVRFHMVELLEKADYPHLETVAELLEETVSLDPGNRDAWLKLARLYRVLEDERARGRVLEEALRHFPSDLKILEAAAEAAVDRGAFKKAAGLTRRLLKIDPINRRARKRLVNAHMRHARKQAGRGRFDLAASEIEEARRWAKDAEDQGRVAVLEALLAFLRGEVPEPSFETAWAFLPSPLLECVVAAEVSGLGFPPKQGKPYLQSLRQVLDHRAMTLDSDIVSRLTDLLVDLDAEGLPMEDLLKAVRPFLKKGTKLAWDEDRRIALLEKLLKLRQYQLIRDYARASPGWKQPAGKRRERPPALVYFDALAKAGGEPGALSYSDVDALGAAHEYACRLQQHRWAARIDKLLEDYEESQSVPLPPGGGELNPFAMLEQLSRETGIPVEKLIKELFSGGKK